MKTESAVEAAIELESARLAVDRKERGRMGAYLVALETPEDRPGAVGESLQELASLVRTLGDECLGVCVQRRSRVNAATYLGAGKVAEIDSAARAIGASYVAVDHELSPSQVRNLEALLHLPVLDRSGVILQIFRKNAKSREARTQVEIAHLEYLAPRLSNSWIAYERQRSGGGTRVRGSGEMQIELDRRRMRERIQSLRRELTKIATERETQRKARGEELQVCLVGYTNAGKTTLMNQLTASSLSAKDALFETLDASVRVMRGHGGTPHILLTDTVGLIRNLPHSLVASFRSTLEEVRRADLILHVTDVSSPRFRDHMEVTDEVLREIGCASIPQLIVFNKFDRLEGESHLPRILSKNYPNSFCISAHQTLDVRRLQETIVQYFTDQMTERRVFVPHSNQLLWRIIHTKTRVLSCEWTAEGGHLTLRLPRAVFQEHFLSSEEDPGGIAIPRAN